MKSLDITGPAFQKIPSGYSLTDYQPIAKKYLKAVCRIYLIDFHCFNYSLPYDCEDLHVELKNHLEELHAVNHRKTIPEHFMSFLRTALPKTILSFIGEIVCFHDPSPRCMASITHGEKGDTVERHDEL
jgi:hypothetical protein